MIFKLFSFYSVLKPRKWIYRIVENQFKSVNVKQCSWHIAIYKKLYHFIVLYNKTARIRWDSKQMKVKFHNTERLEKVTQKNNITSKSRTHAVFIQEKEWSTDRGLDGSGGRQTWTLVELQSEIFWIPFRLILLWEKKLEDWTRDSLYFKYKKIVVFKKENLFFAFGLFFMRLV